jgi:hypothetical protein
MKAMYIDTTTRPVRPTELPPSKAWWPQSEVAGRSDAASAEVMLTNEPAASGRRAPTKEHRMSMFNTSRPAELA